ncbi:PREDICTED: F-box/FBD/LRR-repeat protein At4g26340-like [Brassica oleracea var. oleracea]|uniref:F-box/FBD/LRR-repeat protein At4g26340-like n=1 Tax=Brassica oleracea var. oleracea TaxID=109376 RepID=UPI0006A6C7C7|nr:PREDICTED: F-box/FBD/LRR-repeat protein At4g26340-like [Brassica oleracea var. oleracea]
MSFAVIIITIVVIVVSFFISQLRSMKPFRFLQSAGSNRVELSLVTTSSYMDIISHLPDDLLLRILSFNTTKDAIPTSLLSKRWRSLWTLAPGLGFKDRNHNDIAQWIHLAVIRHLRELRIETRPSKQVSIALPSTLYTSETLQRLTLINCLLLDVPAHVLIPSLKTLSLKFVTCSVTDKTSLQRLLSGCPNLEELSVEQDLIDFNIVVPSLQRLHMSQQSFESRRLYVLDAPSLKYLKITDTVSWNLRQIENMPELVRAHVNIWGGDSTQRFLKALTSVRHLTLSMTTPKFVNPSGVIFNQLVHLVLCTFSGHCWDLVICMLQDSPKLRFLKLIDDELGIYLSGIDIPTGWKQPSSVPECLLHSLEAFEWFGYRGRQGEKEMATYVLKNATCLKTATFSPLSTDLGEKYQMLKELASVATASASCQLLLD